MPPLLHTPDQITERPLVALRVMLVPTAKLAEPVVPTGTFSPAGVERTLSPARPVAVRVSSAVVLPAATVPLVTKLTAVARTSGTARAANGVTVAVPEMPPTVIVAPVQPAGKRAGSMLMRLSRVLVPSVRASPAAGKPGRLGFSPPTRASVARRTAPMHPPPEQLSPLVVALPSLHASALLRCPQPTAGGGQKSVVPTLASSPVFGAPAPAPRVP